MDSPKPQNNHQHKKVRGKKGKNHAQATSQPTTETAASTDKAAEPQRFMQTMAVWLEGADCPRTDDNILTGWSQRYAEQFDREDEPEELDLAPVLGLPQGADHDALVRAAEALEEDLLKQLMS